MRKIIALTLSLAILAGCGGQIVGPDRPNARASRVSDSLTIDTVTATFYGDTLEVGGGG